MSKGEAEAPLKDFTEVLQQKQAKPPKLNPHPHLSLKDLQQFTVKQRTKYDIYKDQAIKVISPLLLTIFTAPFNTASILLQVSNKNSNESLERKVKIWPNNQLIKSGIYGDNKIYKCFSFKGYSDCLEQLGKEGVRGFYKGNFTSIILLAAYSKIRAELYQNLNKVSNFSQQWKANLLTIFTCSVADLVTLPLICSQTRLVFQNSLSNFRTYSSFFDILKQTPIKQLFAGSSLLLIKNTMLTLSWKSLIPNNPVQSFILSTTLSHILTYPFITIIRQLQSNSLGTPMMHQRKQNVRQCVKRIWNQMGFRGFYRGFLGYAMVHTFLNFIMVDMNIRSGYFNEISV